MKMRDGKLMPFAMGGGMAAAMLWMGHDRIMSGEGALTSSAVLFVAAHVVVVLLVMSLALISPRLRTVARKHRPDLSHIVIMLAGMLLTAGSIHILIHGALS